MSRSSSHMVIPFVSGSVTKEFRQPPFDQEHPRSILPDDLMRLPCPAPPIAAAASSHPVNTDRQVIPAGTPNPAILPRAPHLTPPIHLATPQAAAVQSLTAAFHGWPLPVIIGNEHSPITGARLRPLALLRPLRASSGLRNRSRLHRNRSAFAGPSAQKSMKGGNHSLTKQHGMEVGRAATGLTHSADAFLKRYRCWRNTDALTEKQGTRRA
jgi:hypothetical protein